MILSLLAFTTKKWGTTNLSSFGNHRKRQLDEGPD